MGEYFKVFEKFTVQWLRRAVPVSHLIGKRVGHSCQVGFARGEVGGDEEVDVAGMAASHKNIARMAGSYRGFPEWKRN